MSVQAITWAFDQDLPPKHAPAKLVLVALANRAGDDGVTFAGQNRIATNCSMSVKSVERHQKTLVALGLIAKVPRRRSSDGLKTSDWIVLGPSGDRGKMCPPDPREYSAGVVRLIQEPKTSVNHPGQPTTLSLGQQTSVSDGSTDKHDGARSVRKKTSSSSDPSGRTDRGRTRARATSRSRRGSRRPDPAEEVYPDIDYPEQVVTLSRAFAEAMIAGGQLAANQGYLHRKRDWLYWTTELLIRGKDWGIDPDNEAWFLELFEWLATNALRSARRNRTWWLNRPQKVAENLHELPDHVPAELWARRHSPQPDPPPCAALLTPPEQLSPVQGMDLYDELVRRPPIYESLPTATCRK